MATVINDLVTEFSFRGSLDPLEQLNGLQGKAIIGLAAVAAGLAAVSAAFHRFAAEQLGVVAGINAVARRSGVAVEALQELNYIAGQTDSTAEAMTSSLQGLAQKIGEASIRGSEDFARLGISVRDSSGAVKSADRVLDELRRRFVSLNLSMVQQQQVAQALGIDPTLLGLLNKTNAEMAEMRGQAAALGILTAEQAEQATAYQKAINGLSFGLDSLKQLIAVGVAPELTRMAGKFTQLLVDNKKWIVEGVQATVKWVGKILAAFKRLLPVFAGVAAGFVAAKVAAVGLVGVLKILGRLPIVLAITGIVLALDDLIVAFRGGKSVIQDFFQDTFGVDIVQETTEAFRELGRILDVIATQMERMDGLLENIPNPMQAGNRTGQRVREWFLDLFDPGTINAGQAAAMGAGTVPAFERTQTRTIDQTNTINVYSNDPDRAGRATVDNLQRQLDNANSQLDSGVW